MKRIGLALLICLFASGVAMAQKFAGPSTDVLGAHLNYGRGCPACHAPHSGAYGNGAAKTANGAAGNIALWGQDVGSLFGQTLTFGQSEHGSYSEPLPGTWDTTRPDVANLLTCLSCHDGNLAKGAMMKNVVYESLPSTYGTYNTIPTLLGNDGTTAGNYLNDHPNGINAIITCNPPPAGFDWDCSNTGGVISWPAGSNMAKFVSNYGFFVQPQTYTGNAIVVCTTCHNQHVMNAVSVTNGLTSGLPTGYYITMFFVRAPYNPGTTTIGSNQNAQFCRECHGGESNEMNGAGVGGTTIPTIF